MQSLQSQIQQSVGILVVKFDSYCCQKRTEDSVSNASFSHTKTMETGTDLDGTLRVLRSLVASIFEAADTCANYLHAVAVFPPYFKHNIPFYYKQT